MKVNTINHLNFNGYAQAPKIASYLGKTSKEIDTIVKRKTQKSKDFLYVLSDRYNMQNFYRNPSEKESPVFVTNIFSLLKKPNRKHFELVSEVHGSIENLQRIFENAGNNSKRLDMASELSKILINGGRPELIAEALESPNGKLYSKNFKKFKSYFILNRDNENAIKELDKMVESKTYDQKKYDIAYRAFLIGKKLQLTQTKNLNPENLSKYYTAEGLGLLKYLTKNLYIPKEEIYAGGDKLLMEIYKTTTKKNLNLRRMIVDYFPQSITANSKADYGISDLENIFTYLDNNKHAKNFTSKLIDSEIPQITLPELDKLLHTVSNKKLDIFSDNAISIIAQTSGEDCLKYMEKEITNPFFETQATRIKRYNNIKYGFTKEETFVEKQIIRFLNCIKILKYKLTKEAPIINTQKHIIEFEVLPHKKINSEEKLQQIETELASKVAAPQDKNKKQTAANKKLVAENIMSIVKGKLGAKTLERQRAEFEKGATKMRLKMLPEIFASVSDTRKTDRAVGKKHINSANKDVLTLFSMINGNNKKFINYLLKKRNADGTRMFEVKEIINTIKKAEAKIKQNKHTNPNYRATDTRKYYNHLYEAKIQQYGKA